MHCKELCDAQSSTLSACACVRIVQFSRVLHVAIRQGHRALADRLANDKAIGYNLNDLHRQVLCSTGAPLRAKVLAASVRKKAFMDQDLTPVHYACINNDTQYLEVSTFIKHVSPGCAGSACCRTGFQSR